MRKGSTNKSIVNERLNQLRPLGWNFKHFSHNHRMPSGAIGFVDHLGNNEHTGHIAFIEDKLSDSDHLRPKQIEYKESVIRTSKHNRLVIYKCLEEDDIETVIKLLRDVVAYGNHY